MTVRQTLFEQALNEEKRLKVLSSLNLKNGWGSYDLLKKLLPNYKPLPALMNWHKSLRLEKGIKGGVRSGKTHALMAEAILLSYINRPYFHLSLSPSFDNACDTVVKTLEELCDDNGLFYQWHKSNRLFTIHYGLKKQDRANILIYGSEMSFKGITAASGDINEPFSIPKKKILVWWERISHPESSRLVRLWGGTAEPDKMQWGWEYWDKKEIENDDSYITTITTYDNIHLTDDYKRRLESKYDSRMREVYMMGKNINLSADRAYYAFDTERSVINSYKPSPDDYRKVILGFDFNVDPMCAVELNIDNGVRVQVAEYVIHSSNTGELCEYIIQQFNSKYDKNDISLLITGDASGRARKTASFGKTDYSIIKEAFERAGYRMETYFPYSNPPVRDRINYTNMLFETGKYKILKKCKQSIKDRGLVTWKKGADGFIIDKSRNDVSHLSDAGDYALWASRREESEEGETFTIESFGESRKYQ